ncbi:hypothetical protein EV144_102560 [Flavobacterium sp. 270]|uniref:hypothetical protein n=1 Tax=Flavobacterium sp. 270 TaxID=2512114 RepID=UPI001064E2E6|nr:hypothetical protein [Flavobacterium sp. 270]TDW50125.1 hypothetical protein EV144_102560 [Flavobacterium sp. 270]
MIRYAPNFIQGVIPVIDKKAEVEGKAEIHGSLFFERQYFYEKPKSYYVDNVLFSGIAGSFSGSLEMEDNQPKGKKKSSQKIPPNLICFNGTVCCKRRKNISF